MTPSLATAPALSEQQLAALRAYWEVYEPNAERLSDEILPLLADHPELGPLIKQIPEEKRKEESLANRERLRHAILAGDWEPYLDGLKGQGATYARMGLSFEAWITLVSIARPLMTRHVVAAYPHDDARVLTALEGLGILLEIVMATLGRAYLDTKDEIIAQHEGVVRELTISRVVLRSIGEAVVTTDPEGRIRSMNPAMERLIGWREDEVVGRPYNEVYPVLISGQPLADEDRFLTRAMATRTVASSRGYDTEIRCADGHDVPVAMTAAPLIDEQGRLIGGVAVIRDVSHEREVDRMKSSLISTVSHELRTPLTMIEGFAELLATRELGEGQAREAVKQIHVASQRLDRLIDDLLSVSRIDSGRLEVRRERVDLRPAIDDALRPFADQRDIEVNVDEVPHVYADREMVLRIVTNLVSNAIKYSPEGGPVTIAARRRDREAEITITDRGIGMSPEDQERAFERFFRVERAEVHNVPGTGLGLYIVKSLVELQGGRIAVDSTPGEGTAIRFTLPVPQGAG